VPELPEVETIRRRLAPRVEGRRLERVRISDPRWTRPLAPAEVEDALTGRRVERLARRGKYLVWELEDDMFLLQHLRMTGAILYDPPAEPAHGRVHIDLDDGHRLVYDDPRRFGTGELALGPEALAAFLDARLGLEPFEEGFTPDHLRALGRASRAPVKAFLLDQRRVAGVGNIYADEALFRARVHPLREARRLDRRLPRPGWRAGLVPGRVPRPSPRRRALSALRHARREARRRRSRDLRLPALPAASSPVSVPVSRSGPA
jgi:formamidopyrimidine-DNA glycosylase